MNCKPDCREFDGVAGVPNGIYKRVNNDGIKWISPDGGYVTTPAITTALEAGYASTPQRDCGVFDSAVKAGANPHTPSGATYTADTAIRSFDPSVQYGVSVTVATATANPVEVSLDSGATWPVVLEAGQSQAWGGTGVAFDATNMRVRGSGGLAATWTMAGD